MGKVKNKNKRKRYDDFSKNLYHEISDFYTIEEFPGKFYKVYDTPHGTFDYYPMADKLNFREKRNGIWWNNWKPDGEKWIRSVLLKQL